MINVGETLPSVNLPVRVDGEFKTLNTTEQFAGKRVVIFALPGAFTPTCSTFQLPTFEEMYDQFKDTGVDEVYYCHNSDGKTLAWDYRYTQIIKWLDLGITEVLTANSLLYGWQGGQLYTIFKGSNDLTFKYLSPRYIEGSLTETKTYKKFYFRTEGDIIIKILIDKMCKHLIMLLYIISVKNIKQN